MDVAPIWKSLGTELKGKVNVATVDCTVETGTQYDCVEKNNS
jgi:hypothetical protein